MVRDRKAISLKIPEEKNGSDLEDFFEGDIKNIPEKKSSRDESIFPSGIFNDIALRSLKALFVTGTDTGVGKTLISAALTLGLKGTYWKPIQTGYPTDSDWVREKTGAEALPEAYHFKEPLSPHAAAKLEGAAVTLKAIRLPAVRPLIVEGAGGVMVPINEHELMLDLIKHLALPALVVARSTLGTINHTLMTLSLLKQYHIPVLGVVLNGPKNRSNKEAIEHFGNVKVIGEVEPVDNLNKETLYKIFKLLTY